jgi:membrane dipeptidase
MFIIDAHLDLSMNAIEWNRDLTQSLDSIRSREYQWKDKPDRGNNMVSLSELRKGNIGLVVATQIARAVDITNPLPGWHSPAQAWAHTQAQLAWYKAMEAANEMTMIKNKNELRAHVSKWNNPENKDLNKPVGYILSLEGADSLIDLTYVDIAYQYGLRAIGPAHYGPGRYANGTDAQGHLTTQGRELLSKMQALNMILDATHLCDDAFWDAMNIYSAPIWASHNNCRSIVNHNRQFSDDMIKALIQKGAVIGAAFDAWMIVPGWTRGSSNPKEMNCNLDKLIDHMIHICDLAGNVNHIGLGTDLDGGFGSEQSPYDIHSIADLQNLNILFQKRGFSELEIQKVLSQNWNDFLDKNLPG